MRRVLLVCAAITFAIACTDNITEPTPDRPLATAGTPSRAGTVAFATTTTEDGLSISTDKDDYQPGDTVHLTGSGWPADDVLDIQLDDEPATHPPHTWTIEVGGDGTFHDSTYVVDVEDLGVTFTLTATSRKTQQSLTVVFTDGAPSVNSFKLNGTTFTFPASPPNADATNPVAVAAGASVTIELTGATVAGSPGRADWKSTEVGFRDGGINFGDTPPAMCNDADLVINNTAQAVVHSFSFAAPTTAGTYDLRVRGFIGDGCTGTSGSLTLNGVLTVQAANTAPNTPANLAQFKADAATSIPTGGATNETSVVLKGDVSDPNLGNTVKLQVEVRPIGTDFTNAMTGESALLPNGSPASVTVGSLVNGTSYHWQARVVDDNGAASTWASFGGGNTEADKDFLIDTDPPTVTINQAVGQADATNSQPINFTVVFSESVCDFATGDVSVTGTAGGTIIATVTGSGTCPSTYNVAVSGITSDGTVIADVAAGVAHDAAENANVASPSEDDNTVTYDATPPAVTINQAAGQADPTNNSTINFTVVFSEPVTGFATGDVTLNGTAGATTATVSGSGDTYNVAVSGMANDGTVTATIAAGVATDLAGNPNEASTSLDNTVTYDATPPAVSNIAPTVIAVNTSFDLTATVNDVGLGGSNIASADYQVDGGSWTSMTAVDGSFNSPTENVKASVPGFPLPDVHDICVRGKDAAGNTGVRCILFAVYDPSAGFVTGGGWIRYDAASCTICGGQPGQGDFGFVSKYVYQKDKTTPVLTGNTRFEFHAGSLLFNSTNYEWLVVSGNATRAQYKGTGQMNGGSTVYGFLLTALDGTPDKFRIKIWNTTTNYVVFDNQMNQAESSDMATALDKVNGNGSIVIHAPKK
jgi:hypothetical protein